MMNKGKRLIPEDLLDYVQDLNNNHPDPSAEWGGASYTAGTGIDISEGEISIDNTVATKTFVENYAEPAEYLFELTGSQGQLTSQQIQKLQSLGADALGKKILIHTGVEDQVVILDTMFNVSRDPNAYTYVGRNSVSVGYDGSATWYGVTVFSNFWINSDPDYNPYTWGLGNERIDLQLKSTDFVKDYTGEIGISSSIARVNDIPAQVQANWNESDTTSKAYIQNKPTIPTVTSSITQGSNDAVTSGAVYNAIGDIESLLAAI